MRWRSTARRSGFPLKETATSSTSLPVSRRSSPPLIDDGLVTVYVSHSTAAISLIEYEPGGVRDLREVMERLIPTNADYHHNQMAGDTNAHAHLRAAVLGPPKSSR